MGAGGVQADEWLVSRRYLSTESPAKLYPEEAASPATIQGKRREALLTAA